MVNERFIRLLTNELCDQLTDVEREELSLLLQGSKEYRDQREILKNYWERDRVEYGANAAMFRRVLERIKAEESGLTVSADADAGAVEEEAGVEGGGRRRRGARIFWYGAAAAAVVAGVLLFAWLHARTPAAQWMQKTTQPTKKLLLTLSDGTIVNVNSATVIKYPAQFGDSSREVYLDGEAYFDVTKDPQRPFIIHTNKMNIRVLGTSFNVKSYQNEASSEATLIKGSIEVTLNDRPSDRIILKPKEKLIVQDNTVIRKQTSIMAGRVAPDSAGKGTRYALTNLTYFHNSNKTVVETSWVENKLIIDNKEFVQFSSQMERWYGVHIEFGNERVKEYRFTALFEKESLTDALDALKMIEHFNYKKTDSTVYIF